MTPASGLITRPVSVTPRLCEPPAIEFDLELWKRFGGELAAAFRTDERALLRRRNGQQWDIGDWLTEGRKGLKKLRALKREAVAATTYPWGTLKNYMMVADAFPVSRRRDKLSWSHHRVVTKFDEETQDKLLDRAVEGNMSRSGRVALTLSEFRREIKRLQGIQLVPTPPDPFVTVTFRLKRENHELLELVLSKHRDLHGQRRIPELIWWLACQSVQYIPAIRMTREEIEAHRSGSTSTETRT